MSEVPLYGRFVKEGHLRWDSLGEVSPRPTSFRPGHTRPFPNALVPFLDTLGSSSALTFRLGHIRSVPSLPTKSTRSLLDPPRCLTHANTVMH